MALAPKNQAGQQTWLHGTEVHFNQWKLPLPKKLKHKNGMAPHSALFFTLSRKYAIDSSEGTGGLVTSTLIPSANVIDLNTCTDSESDAFRRQVLTKETACDNQQYLTLENWREACKTGSVMKYAPPAEKEPFLRALHYQSQNEFHTNAGRIAWNQLQLLTRNNIEDIVLAAIDLGYDAVITNEIDTLDPLGPQTYPIMFATKANVLTKPVWLKQPPVSASEIKRNKDSAKKSKKKLAKKNKRINRKN